MATFGALYPPDDLAHYLVRTYATPVIAAELADPAYRYRLASAPDRLVGYARCGAFKLPFDPGARTPFELHRLYVAEAVKGAGVAAELMAWALTEAQGAGADDVYLGVYQGNARAQRFYARFGFEVVGAYAFEVGATRDPEYIMRKRLT